MILSLHAHVSHNTPLPPTVITAKNILQRDARDTLPEAHDGVGGGDEDNCAHATNGVMYPIQRAALLRDFEQENTTGKSWTYPWNKDIGRVENKNAKKKKKKNQKKKKKKKKKKKLQRESNITHRSPPPPHSPEPWIWQWQWR